MPARPLHAAWRHLSGPPVEWFIGRHDVVHGSNFVVPPTARAARVVTVHDLTVVLYPELCDRPTLAFPAFIRRAVAEGAWVHTPSQFVADRSSPSSASTRSGSGPCTTGYPGRRWTRRRRHGALPFALPDGCRRYVLAIGTIEPRKDYPLLVSAFASVAAAHPDVALVVVGSDGWGADRFRAAVEASPARSRIVRPGYLDGRAAGGRAGQRVGAGLPVALRGVRLPPAAGHGGRGPGGGHRRRGHSRSGR